MTENTVIGHKRFLFETLGKWENWVNPPPFYWRSLIITFMYRKHNSVHSSQLGGQFFSLCLFQFGSASHWFVAQDVASTMTADLMVSVVVICPDSFYQLSQCSFVFLLNCLKATVMRVFLWTRRPSVAFPLITR